MASGLEQTRRNSAILGCLTLSSIFASFPRKICLPFRPSAKSGSDRWKRGSDRTGVFAFSAEELFWEKLFLIMTQVARIRNQSSHNRSLTYD